MNLVLRDRENKMNYHQTIGKRETIDLIFQPYQDSLDWFLKHAAR